MCWHNTDGTIGQHTKGKTDERDAEGVLQSLRGWLLAGNSAAGGVDSDRKTRDDRRWFEMRLEWRTQLTLQEPDSLPAEAEQRGPSPMKALTGDYDVWLNLRPSRCCPVGPGWPCPACCVSWSTGVGTGSAVCELVN